MSGEPPTDEFASLDEDGKYVCPACGEQIVTPVDRSAGDVQQYVEDCPVCCHPNRLTVRWDGSSDATIMCEPE